jgi:hypothetical protein
MPKVKAPIVTSKEALKTPIKSPKKAVVADEVEEVVICQNSRGRIIKLPERFKSKK